MPSDCNFNLVEGSWKSFNFRKITPLDYPKVFDHIEKYFLREEPTCKLLGHCTAFAEQMKTVIFGLLEDNLSFLAEETISKEIAAVRITFRQLKNCPFEEIIEPEALHWKTDAFLNAIDLTERQKTGIFSSWGIDEYAELFIVATNPKFRNQGLSMELYNRSLKFLKAEGFKLAKCIFTNPTTRRAGLRLGFKEFCTLDYSQLKRRDGKPLFTKEKLNEEHYAVISLKSLM